ncbi:hypothetical protein [Yersinia pekkanenii]|uniref:Phage exported protein n=1 Tax=Yersinia pekkanenii TaxID=1288385 RepID=A0A0T9RH84_9GAMM|nr:hypothetical protein [Yersinia pekkanenii]CNI62777.1 Uncharacterised protein [Yersinia pekkanenii]CRY67563.1 Uncharacterised protein [Yersinia pekkanenii]
MNSIRIWLIILSCGALVTLSLIAMHYSNKADKVEGERKQLAADLSLTSTTLATQSFQFQSFNEIASNANQYAARVGAEIKEREIEYRTIIKVEPCADKYIPDVIADRLLSYTESLRSRALYPDTGKTDSAASRSITARRLTYAQAVLWIEPLLGLLDEANKDRQSIREIEHIRATPAPQS